MTQTTTGTRIRWERNDDGAHVTPAYVGYAGTIDEQVFFIFEPADREPWWILTSSLPGLPGPGRAKRRAYGDDTDQLKAEAERWLEDFVSALGAVFPETRDGTPRCPRDHMKWGRGLEMDRIPGAGWACPGILADGRDCGLELGPDGEPR